MKINLVIKLIIIGWAFFTATAGLAQKRKNNIVIDSVKVYKSYFQHGTTANIRHNFKSLDSTNHQFISMTNEDVEELNSFITSTKRKKLFQQKYGGEVCYALIYLDNTFFRCVITTYPKYFAVDNLSQMHRYSTTDSVKIKQLKKMIFKYWK